mmetsp:Transcript_75865/g.235382  ORF Transcript_75865/g.235382 Transcript_75865/m.235382 type:complete len:212 (+) Transcript_75865:470-1105(+)
MSSSTRSAVNEEMGMPTRYSKSLMSFAIAERAEPPLGPTPPPAASASASPASPSSASASSCSSASPSSPPSGASSAPAPWPRISRTALKPRLRRSCTRSVIFRRLMMSSPLITSLMKRALASSTSHSRMRRPSRNALRFSYIVTRSFAKSLMMSRGVSYLWILPSGSKSTMLFSEIEEWSLKVFSRDSICRTPSGASTNSKWTLRSVWCSA